MTKVIIFDLDGTVLDAYGAIEKSLNYTLKKLNYPPASKLRARRAVGFGDRNFIERFFKNADAKEALRIYRRHHKKALLKHSFAKEGARRVLGLFKKQGYKLAIASNRPQRFSDILLRHLKLRKYFDIVLCAKDRTEIKPRPKLLFKIMRRLNIEKPDAIYVGDMIIDVQAGKNAGIKTIAITGGTSFKYELKRERPFRIISRLSQLLKII